MTETETEIEPSGPARRGNNLDSMMPVLLFLVFYNVVNIKAAVIASTVWSIKAAVGRKRRGLDIGVWLPGITIVGPFSGPISERAMMMLIIPQLNSWLWT